MELSGIIYRCSAGETFDSVALEVYGDENCAADLLCANPEHAAAVRFEGGERLYVPVVTLPVTEDDEPMTEPVKAPWKE